LRLRRQSPLKLGSDSAEVVGISISPPATGLNHYLIAIECRVELLICTLHDLPELNEFNEPSPTTAR